MIVAVESNKLEEKDEQDGRSAPRPRSLGELRSSRVALNSGVLVSLLMLGAFAVLHSDLQAIYALYATPDWAIPDAASSRLEICAEILGRLPTDWLRWYDAEALSRPIITKASTSAVCYYAGDLIAQASTGATVANLDLRRAFRSSAAGFIGHGPVAHYWLQFVDTQLSFGGAWWAFFPKVILDQGPMSIVYNTVYTVLIGAFALRSPADVARDVRETWLPGMKASLRFWPFVHLITFSPLVPLELKLLWVDAVEIVWIAILSRVNAREQDSDETRRDAAAA